MDWNKTKTIFIIVFSILNVFLYSLYVNRHTEAQNVPVLGKTTIEEALKLDHITYELLPIYQNDSSYVSAKIVPYRKDEVEKLGGQVVVIMNGTRIQSKMTTDVSIQNSKGEYYFTDFLSKYVVNGGEYELWEVDEDNRKAIFFQKTNGEPIFFSPKASLIVHWNREGEVTTYEQSMLEDFVNFNRKKDLLSPLEAIGTLNSRGYLKPDSKITRVSLGYSTLVQLTETQVFAPTWHIRVQLKDGEIEDYFVNAIEGKVIEFQLDSLEEGTG